MKAMILAAGTGTRLRPLTQTTPKPLLRVGAETLIERHLGKLAAAGFTEIVINVCYKKQMIMDALGDGNRYGVQIIYSDEGEEPLETGGGIKKALSLLGDEVCLIVNADVYTDWRPQRLDLPKQRQAHLLMVDNPPHHPHGDFGLYHGSVIATPTNRLTYAGIGYYRPALFSSLSVRRFKLAPVLTTAIQRGAVGGEHYRGLWMDAGTPMSLARLQDTIAQRS